MELRYFNDNVKSRRSLILWIRQHGMREAWNKTGPHLCVCEHESLSHSMGDCEYGQNLNRQLSAPVYYGHID